MTVGTKRFGYIGILVVWMATGCGSTGGPADSPIHADHGGGGLSALFDDYLEFLFESSPTTATGLGVYSRNGELDDLSAEAIAKREEGNAAFLARLTALDRESLTAAEQADADLLQNELAGSLFSLRKLRPYATNPRVYGGLVSGSVYDLLKRDFSPLDERVRDAISRMRKTPALLDQARANLEAPPKPHVEVAIRQNQGAIAFYGDEIGEFVKGSSLADEAIAEGAKLAESLKEYQTWLEEELLPKATGDWRLGRELWEEKLAYSLNSSLTGPEIRERAEREYETVRAQMYEVAQELWPLYFPGTEPPQGDDALQRTVKAVIDAVASEHSTRETIVEDARRVVVDLKVFLRHHRLLDLPDPDRLNVITMPEFQAGVSTAYLDPAPALDPNGKSFYAIEPMPSSWSDDEVESRLREYNRHMLKILSIHEGYPGHYVQLEYSNRFPSKIRKVLGNGPMIEGWAVYTERMMYEAGFTGFDPRFRLNQLKFYLRAVINALIDQGLHLGEMTDEEALSLMIDGGFQERNEATGKLTRAKITSTQLSTYFVGFQEVWSLRQDVEAAEGEAFSLKSFHERFLSQGSPPVRVIREVLLP